MELFGSFKTVAIVLQMVFPTLSAGSTSTLDGFSGANGAK